MKYTILKADFILVMIRRSFLLGMNLNDADPKI